MLEKDDFTYTIKQQMITKIISNQEKETLKAIQKYCEENNIIPNIIDKEKLDLILKLGIAEYERRNLVESEEII